MNDCHQLKGPDFLEAVAQAESANGLQLNASEYSRRAAEWKRDLAEIDRLTSVIADFEHRMAIIQRNACASPTN